MIKFDNDWDSLLHNEFNKEYYNNISEFLKKEYKNKQIYPSENEIFTSLFFTSYSNTKVVILGQDPYHQPNQANGLAFSVKQNMPLPPSLKNIFKEINSNFAIPIPTNGDLTQWARQGVLLLNTILTVEKNKPNSHKKIGWTIFTDKIITLLNQKDTPIVFMLWGNNAKSKQHLITNKIHLVLTSTHPSPLSAYNGFFGCNHFLKANEFLKDNAIDWNIY